MHSLSDSSIIEHRMDRAFPSVPPKGLSRASFKKVEADPETQAFVDTIILPKNVGELRKKLETKEASTGLMTSDVLTATTETSRRRLNELLDAFPRGPEPEEEDAFRVDERILRDRALHGTPGQKAQVLALLPHFLKPLNENSSGKWQLNDARKAIISDVAKSSEADSEPVQAIFQEFRDKTKEILKNNKLDYSKKLHQYPELKFQLDVMLSILKKASYDTASAAAKELKELREGVQENTRIGKPVMAKNVLEGEIIQNLMSAARWRAERNRTEQNLIPMGNAYGFTFSSGLPFAR